MTEKRPSNSKPRICASAVLRMDWATPAVAEAKFTSRCMSEIFVRKIAELSVSRRSKAWIFAPTS